MAISKVVIDDDSVGAASQKSEHVEIAAIVKESCGAIAKAELSATRVLAAESLGSGAIDLSAVVVDPPHNIADENTSSLQPTHPSPNGSVFVGVWLKGAFADNERIGCAVVNIADVR